MRLLLAGGDVGGIRGLVPVARQGLSDGVSCQLVRHGALIGEWPNDAAPWVEPDTIDWSSVDAFLFSSSVADPVALRLARQAAARNVPTFHLLDHWSGYRARMIVDGGPPFRPDRYFVMDEMARAEAVADGIASETVEIVGQPALQDLADFAVPSNRRRSGGVLFVGEPVAADQGCDDRSPAYRGYTEVDAVSLFAGTIGRLQPGLRIRLLPHPRQDPADFEAIWRRHGHELPVEMATARRGRDLFGEVQGVVGMASMLLYEAWLCGLPVLSVQPGRRRPYLDVLANRPAAWLIDRPDRADAAISAWLAALTDPPAGADQARILANCRQSPMRVLAAIRTLLADRSFA